MLRRLGLALGLALSPTLATAAGEVTEFTLDNGMQVIVIEDHRSPTVTHMVWYRAGAADELPGQSGIAHFLEHLMFKATDELATREFSRIVEANGGSDNAFTSWDYTAYHQTVAADRLGLMMQMEADRMRDLRFDPVEVDTERSVVLEERAQRLDTSPGGLFNEQLSAAMYLNHPYSRPIIGWRHEIEGLPLEDAQAWYALPYHRSVRVGFYVRPRARNADRRRDVPVRRRLLRQHVARSLHLHLAEHAGPRPVVGAGGSGYSGRNR